MIHHDYYKSDLDSSIHVLPDLTTLRGKSVLLTGASGMLCSCLVDMLMRINTCLGLDITVYALARNMDKLRRRFASYLQDALFHVVEQDISKEFAFDFHVDYIIHGASNADPVAMSRYPVDTIEANFTGMSHLLRYGRGCGVQRFLYVSSGEMYGQPDASGADFVETYSGYVDYANPRSCYPSGKRAAEALCQANISQYGTDIVIVRPCHLFGPTMTETDSRAVSQFLRGAADHQDIVLKSAGVLERSHCYVVDAASAVLFVLLKGRTGEAYNIADRQYQMTIREFAKATADAAGQNVVMDIPDEVERKGYSTVSRSVLDSSKLETLGWHAITDEISAIEKTVRILREAKGM